MNSLFVISPLILNGTEVLSGLLLVSLSISIGIFSFKYYLNQKRDFLVSNKNNTSESSVIRKYKEVDILDHRKNIKLIGVISALTIVLILFGWTQFSTERVFESFVVEPENIEIEIPPTTHPKPKLPPALPPPPVKKSPLIKIVPEPEPKSDPEPQKAVVSNNTPVDYTGKTSEETTEYQNMVIEPEPLPEKRDELYIHVEQFPRFPGCEDIDGDQNAKKICSEKKLMKFVYNNISYPVTAREIEHEGLAVIGFVVTEEGKIKDYKIIRDPGAGLGKEALRVVKLMDRKKIIWTAGRQQGIKVKVRYTLPVRFKIRD